tara:strand:- start:2546 stop:3406 length:861 start_codon:yes stop_codon:yes gene_type:complete
MWYKTENINITNLSNELKNIVNFISNNINYYEGVSIASGIGDILLLKSSCDDNTIINWNIKHLIDYKPFPDNLINIKFNIELLQILFKKEQLNIFYNNKCTLNNKLGHIRSFDLTSYFTLQNEYPEKYIVIHTKLRLRRNEGNIVKKIKLALQKSFSNIKSRYKIIILGEKILAENSATKAIPSMTTIYNECMLLKNNNNIIDLTQDVMYNTPCIKQFEKDIGIINNSICNIGVGHGGQFCFNLLFSKNSIYYTPPGLINMNVNNEMKLITTINDFIYHIEQIMIS